MTESYYESYWKTGKLEIGSHTDWKMEKLLKLRLKGSNLLDVGCGDGMMCAPFVNKYDVHGIDISPHAIEQAKAKGIKARVIDADCLRLPYDSASFDNIMCLDVLEHIMDPLGFTMEIKRVLKPDGSLIVCVPNILNVFNRIHFLAGEFVDIMDVAHKNQELFSEHIRLFSKAKLERLLAESGFTTITKHYYFPQSFNEKQWKRFQLIGDMINYLKIPQLLPSLFALGFLYVCKK